MTETILVRKAKNGSEKAYRKLFDLYASRLFRFLRQFSQDRDIVEDWVQQTFIKAFRNINRFEERSKFVTWLFQIGLNEMRNEFSRKNIFDNNYPPDENYAKDENIEETFEWFHEMKWLLSGIDAEKRAIFLLFEVEGYSHSEISEMMNISEQKSRTTLSRTKTFLRDKWNSERKI
jgi:RNA polymerase sigma factor (sigma-70 family)